MDDVPEGSLARSNMQEVLTAAKRARDMVRQILDFSRQSIQERKPRRVQPVIENNAEVPPETVSMESIPGGNEHILFVDDEENIVHMVQQMLERFGYQVTAQTSSIAALEAFRKLPEKFDIIITDQTMPNMTGEELAKALIQMRPDIPVILCTGFSEIIPEEKAKAIGIKDYIMKPVLKSELAKSVRRVLDAENEK